MNPNISAQESSRMSRPAQVESSGPPMGFQFDNARKRAIRLAKEQSDQSLDQQRGKEINASQPTPLQPGLQQPPWVQPIPVPPLAPGPPPSMLGGLRPSKEEGNDRNTRPSSWYGPPSTMNSESMDLLEERRKDREERRQERMEREQERVVRVHELQEREHERTERREEREERRREREERVRSVGSTALDNASAKWILDLELKNEAMNSKMESLTNHLMSLKESTDVQFRKMKQALEAEQKKVNALVEYINLFQFPDEKVADLNRLRSVVFFAQQKSANLTALTHANWWSRLGPSQNTKDRYEKALQNLKHMRPNPNTTAFLQNEEAMAYVVEHDSRVVGQRNHDYTTFGKFSREVYENSWQRLNQNVEGTSVMGPVTAFSALLDFIFQEN